MSGYLQNVMDYSILSHMEGATNNPKDKRNFHEIAERRKDIRKAARDLATVDGSSVFDKHYREPLEEANKQAFGFRVKDFGSFAGAREALKKQKAEYEAVVLKDAADIDYEAIVAKTPEISDVRRVMQDIAALKDFRMRRMFEILSPKTSLSTKQRNRGVLKTIEEEIEAGEKKWNNPIHQFYTKQNFLGTKKI